MSFLVIDGGGHGLLFEDLHIEHHKQTKAEKQDIIDRPGLV